MKPAGLAIDSPAGSDVGFWPNSAIAASRPGRRLSGDKLPTRADLDRSRH